MSLKDALKQGEANRKNEKFLPNDGFKRQLDILETACRKKLEMGDNQEEKKEATSENEEEKKE